MPNVIYNIHPTLKSVHEKSQSVMGSKLFSSYRTVFELAQSPPDSKTSDLNCSHETLGQKEAMTICHNMVSFVSLLRIFVSFTCSMIIISFRKFHSCIILIMVCIQKFFYKLVALRTEYLSGKPISFLWSKYFWDSCPKLLVIFPQESFQLKLSTVTKTHYSAIRYCITLRNNILGFKDPSHLLLHYLQRLLTLDSCVVYI